MLWLAAHMWILLIAAFAVGIGVGWWLWGARAQGAAPLSDDEQPMGTLEIDFEAPDDESHAVR